MDDVAHGPVRPDMMNLRPSSERDAEISPADAAVHAKSLLDCVEGGQSKTRCTVRYIQETSQHKHQCMLVYI